MDIIRSWEIVPEIEFINSFCDDRNFIDAFVARSREMKPENYDHILFSFHGLPERQIKKGDVFDHCLKNGCCDELTDKNAFCYRAQCYQTARKMAEKSGIPPEQYTVCFQSRLGKNPWIKPYSDDVIRELGEKGVKRLLVFAPAFVSDCLETIYEIGVEYDELFKKYGGEKVRLVPSLNDSPEWINGMRQMILSRIPVLA
jgi:ferrochelatase